ncbi:HK97 gp10 family phage protein [Salibacterium lacus]|uniref:HK97 gp10 family phage protein n=1 Tax=Salibacterium lacus TaxID=1898109 RepID=A0ABW5SYR8_9BACI
MITKRGDITFEKAIERFEQQIIDEVKRIVAETTEIIVSEAKALAPVDEGNLRRSIEPEYDNDGLSAMITVGAEYGIKRMSSLLVTAG